MNPNFGRGGFVYLVLLELDFLVFQTFEIYRSSIGGVYGDL